MDFIKNILKNWHKQNAKQRELTTTIIRMMLNLIINNMEIRLSNPSAHHELRDIYEAAIRLIDEVESTYGNLSESQKTSEGTSISKDSET